MSNINKSSYQNISTAITSSNMNEALIPSNIEYNKATANRTDKKLELRLNDSQLRRRRIRSKAKPKNFKIKLKPHTSDIQSIHQSVKCNNIYYYSDVFNKILEFCNGIYSIETSLIQINSIDKKYIEGLFDTVVWRDPIEKIDTDKLVNCFSKDKTPCFKLSSATKSDFYNANEINLSGKKYIAAEGPSIETLATFIALIDEINAPVSVSLVSQDEFNGLTKNVKLKFIENTEECFKFLDIKNINSVKVKFLTSISANNFCVDLLLINNKLHARIYLLDWLDHTPANIIDLAKLSALIQQIKQLIIKKNHDVNIINYNLPLLVNCNTGICRTISFCLADNIFHKEIHKINSLNLEITKEDNNIYSDMIAAKYSRYHALSYVNQFSTVALLQKNLDTFRKLCRVYFDVLNLK